MVSENEMLKTKNVRGSEGRGQGQARAKAIRVRPVTRVCTCTVCTWCTVVALALAVAVAFALMPTAKWKEAYLTGRGPDLINDHDGMIGLFGYDTCRGRPLLRPLRPLRPLPPLRLVVTRVGCKAKRAQVPTQGHKYTRTQVQLSPAAHILITI